MLCKLVAKKLTKKETDRLVQSVVVELQNLEGLSQMILFGSAASYTMSEASDIDVVLIFKTSELAKQGSKKVYQIQNKYRWPRDLICVDEKQYHKKSVIGGVLFVARSEGRTIFKLEKSLSGQRKLLIRNKN